MSYFRLLGLDQEPFSTSPDPAFFYESQEHHAALIRLMVNIRLRRGLSVVLGDVGTGKTTLSRKMFQMLSERDDIIFHLILDPTYETKELFLESLIRTFKLEIREKPPSILTLKQAIEAYLFQKGVEEHRTVVLVLDEAQELNSLSLEILRVLLNYETNEYKLLQLVLLGQLELLPMLRDIKNVRDRISMQYVLNPLSEQETAQMIRFRLERAGYSQSRPLFTEEAIHLIYEQSQGYPRRIAMLCHNALEALVMESKPIVDNDILSGLLAKELL